MTESDLKPLSIKRKILFSLIAFILGLIVLVSASEILFSIVLGDDYFPIYARVDPDLGYSYTPIGNTKQVIFAFKNDDGSWFKYHFETRINSTGFRGGEFDIKNDNALRIMSIGDSSAYGWGENEEYIYTSRLERILDGISETSVLNFGIPGYSSAQGLVLLKKYIETVKPDAVTINFGANDGVDIYQKSLFDFLPSLPDKEIFGKPIPQSDAYKTYHFLLDNKILGPLTRNSRTICWLTTWLELRHTIPKLAGIRRVSLEDFKKNLGSMIDIVEKNGGKGVIVMSCVLPDSIQAAREVALAKNIPLIVLPELAENLDPNLYPNEYSIIKKRYGETLLSQKKELLYTNDSCHPNPIGHLLIAQQLASILQK